MDYSKLEEEVAACTHKVISKCRAYSKANLFIVSAAIDAYKDQDGDSFGYLKELTGALGGCDLEELNYFSSVLFVDVVSTFEVYLSELVRVAIRLHPKKVGSASFSLSDVLDAENKEFLVARAADEYLYKLMYKRPGEYLTEICNVLGVDRKDFEDLWPGFVESKARRDLGVHNNWVCNDVYFKKLKEAGYKTEYKVGDRIVPDHSEYCFDAVNNIASIVWALHEGFFGGAPKK